jgi:hypothetical protein
VALANMINQAHGGAVIAAWQVGQLDEGTLDAYRRLANDLPKMGQQVQRIEGAKAKIREQHRRH